MAELRIEGVAKTFGQTRVLHDIDVTVPDGGFLSLLGPSGCGKTTLMRIVAGLEVPSAGRVLIGGRDVTDLAPEARNIALMFQSYALMPHLTVAENVRFPLRMRRQGSRAEQEARVAEALELVQLSALAGRMPRQLSGGQQQRVALARAIVARPDVLLLDEPLSNLDARLREDMQVELIELHRRLKLTTVFVTHDQDEALSLSDRVAVMQGGRIEQEDAPDALYDRPATRFVAEFIGGANVIELAPPGALGVSGARLVLPPGAAPEGARAVALRQEDLALTADPAGADYALPVKIETRIFLGARARYRLRAGGLVLLAMVPRGALAQADVATHVVWSAQAMRFLSR
ncbi:MAG: Fe3+/spermidine/putrescine ABC transporter ATP-binding protein [Paracoccaceae bacterium]|nr:MAG: Fe3+/spermidine/putrescine ABC transporter ATP-binding protein [Paracoccaceae bacterium]